MLRSSGGFVNPQFDFMLLFSGLRYDGLPSPSRGELVNLDGRGRPSYKGLAKMLITPKENYLFLKCADVLL